MRARLKEKAYSSGKISVPIAVISLREYLQGTIRELQFLLSSCEPYMLNCKQKEQLFQAMKQYRENFIAAALIIEKNDWINHCGCDPKIGCIHTERPCGGGGAELCFHRDHQGGYSVPILQNHI